MSYKLSEIVNEFLIEVGEGQASKFSRIYAIAVSGMRELHMDINGLVKVVQLTINANDTVDLPSDYLQYSKVGLYGADGRIHSLGLDNSLSLNKIFNSCGVPQKHNNQQSVDSFAIQFDNSVNALWTGWPGILGVNGGIFGLGGGNNANGYYRYDRASNQLLLSDVRVSAAGILLEYISDLSSSDGDFIVHPFEVQTIKDWISWKYVSNDRNTPLGEKVNRERMYYNSRRNMNIRYTSATPEEWASSLRLSNTATTRF